ncbi:hypothetical protein OIU84_000022 [Salix udensis]|uniref:Uncharacterized protein n=1 Tax=Salix udensis TaxID=889485 RepID=A0AAD6L3Q3_9ROSI|nr:hypothetical protein OIU84_000022 [Salix udensis]
MEIFNFLLMPQNLNCFTIALQEIHFGCLRVLLVLRYNHCLLTVHFHSCTLKSFTINGGLELVVDAPNLEFHELKDCIPKDLNSMRLTALAKAVVGANVKNATTTFDDYVEMVRFLRQISYV